MPRYFFHLHNDMNVIDDLGKELPDLAQARAEALSLARFEASESARSEGKIVLSHRIDVEDRDGKVLATVTFEDAVTITP
jgi:hypothetical protein